MTLAIDLTEDDINRANDRDYVCEEAADRQHFQRLQVHERRRSLVPAVGPVRAIADDIESEFALRAFDARVGLASRDMIAFRIELKVVDERFHRSI